MKRSITGKQKSKERGNITIQEKQIKIFMRLSWIRLKIYSELLINEQKDPIRLCQMVFFDFPINKVEHYAFPYFVRDDDVGFRLVHKFKKVKI